MRRIVLNIPKNAPNFVIQNYLVKVNIFVILLALTLKSDVLYTHSRLFYIPPRGSKDWKNEFAQRSSTERSNKRQEKNYKLEDGKHRSSKMWYRQLYAIMMLQHLDAWEMSSLKAFQIIFVKRGP